MTGDQGVPLLDLNDELVRAMADRNHLPSERWNDHGELVRVVCAECTHPWPCETRQALRDRSAEQS